ncbi:hypothetical protein GLOTRDRAFT_134104 [Gloeophyllum trabeum ATCC 11539]|uniref:F-box domain-containing protein n=1 Tax=Gloeophyllum trabeum (strain ATCC 11539 / FP-39264 / Madison 617) TaxID=670483 RepID=S7R7D6_GLOTA|nr:uncharacterized protein GLOTRDRAFT_134104 [Gloeophyllum trabeum ATCC 11539]EPQ50295.1 hypothetical protein GLOTRDRAFT_134104 [Gloeophyllum trabeum ATCC 11539]
MPANLHLLRGLTSLELMDQPHYEEPPSLLDFRNVLTQCPALRHLGLDGCGFASDLDIRSLHPDPLYLPLLKSLKICFVNYWIEEDSCVQVLFDVFGAPNLDSLQLVSLSRNTCEAFIRVLEKKPLACGSESLCLLYLHSGEEGARINLGASLSARMLALFPNVQHLWIDADKEDGDDFIIALQWNKEPLCTSLHTLTLNIGSGQFEVLDNGGTYLRDFIAGRETNGLPITTLRLYPASEAYQATELLSWCHEKVTMEVLGDREIEFDCFEMSEKMVPSLMNLH